MLGSALDTAIGLALLFFVLATAASALVELVSKRVKKRHRDLEQALGAMLSGQPVDWTGSATLDARFRGTSIYRSAEVAAGKAGVAYLSAKSFADASVELARTADAVPAGLVARMEQVYADVGGDLLRFKAGLESWFDETMASLEGQYKKWATTWLFFAGLVLAVLTNASAVDVARDLWNDDATRAAVVAAAEATTAQGQDATTIADVARTTDALEELSLPVGWSTFSNDLGWWATHLVGWVLTAALLMLGAPFWFDLLSRLVSLRNAGKSPAAAPRDDASATASVMRAEAANTPLPAPAAPAAAPQAGMSAGLTGLLRPPAVAVLPTLPELAAPLSGTAGKAAARLAGR